MTDRYEELARERMKKRTNGGHAIRHIGNERSGYGFESACDGIDCHRENCSYPDTLAEEASFLRRVAEEAQQQPPPLCTGSGTPMTDFSPVMSDIPSTGRCGICNQVVPVFMHNFTTCPHPYHAVQPERYECSNCGEGGHIATLESELSAAREQEQEWYESFHREMCRADDAESVLVAAREQVQEWKCKTEDLCWAYGNHLIEHGAGSRCREQVRRLEDGWRKTAEELALLKETKIDCRTGQCSALPVTKRCQVCLIHAVAMETEQVRRLTEEVAACDGHAYLRDEITRLRAALETIACREDWSDEAPSVARAALAETAQEGCPECHGASNQHSSTCQAARS